MIRQALIALFAFTAGGGHAQEHPFLSEYILTELDGAIRVDWTMQGGSTCNGIDVERATDATDFAVVHHIAGICGDPANSIPFQWIDAMPPEFSTLYYRIKLGFDGYSSVKTVHFDQLVESQQRLYPSPMQDLATLVLNIPAGNTVDLRIWDARGRLVLERNAIPGAVIPVSLPGAGPGVYRYAATGVGHEFHGGFVKE